MDTVAQAAIVIQPARLEAGQQQQRHFGHFVARESIATGLFQYCLFTHLTLR